MAIKRHSKKDFFLNFFPCFYILIVIFFLTVGTVALYVAKKKKFIRKPLNEVDATERKTSVKRRKLNGEKVKKQQRREMNGKCCFIDHLPSHYLVNFC